MAVEKIVLDPRIVGKKVYHITTEFVKSVLTQEELESKFNLRNETEPVDVVVDFNIDGFLKDEVLIKINELKSKIESADYINGVELCYTTRPTVEFTSHGKTKEVFDDPVEYFRDKWVRDLHKYNDQQAEFKQYQELESKFSSWVVDE